MNVTKNSLLLFGQYLKIPKQGISNLQLATQLGIKQKSIWFVNHRIREMLKDNTSAKPLSGMIEVDETYVD